MLKIVRAIEKRVYQCWNNKLPILIKVGVKEQG